MTKLDKNGQLIFESVPGSAVHNFVATTDGVAFEIESSSDVQVTLEVEAGQEYKVFIDNTNVGMMKANLGGKLTLSVELNMKKQQHLFAQRKNSSNIKGAPMAKQKTVYFCSQCGHESSSGWDNVLTCKQWNTFTEEKVTETKKEGRL